MIRMFDISVPGRDCKNYTTVTQKGNVRFIPRNMQLKGIVSSFSFTPDGAVVAAGSYGGNVGLYNAEGLEPVGMLYDAHPSGVSQVMFSADGNHLYTGGRKDDFIHCWDVRNTMSIVFSIARPVANNQRIAFSLDHTGRYLTSGLQDGRLQVFDVYAQGRAVTEVQAHGDVVNAASFHPYMHLIATSSGQRHFESDSSDSSDEEDDHIAVPQHDYAVSIWKANIPAES
jgi:telomerase Cajal body protein 1